jgi:hypothetical protein
MSSTVLIITNEQDEHADAVVLELHRRNVPVFRLHPEDFPHACSISLEIHQDGHIEGELKNAYHRVALEDVCAAWFRRSRNLFSEPPSLTSGKLDNYVKAQSGAILSALCHGLQTLWVGHPYQLRRAEVKALQLAEASKAGLKIPNTLMSNDPAQAAVFVQSLGDTQCAIKPLMALGVGDQQGWRLPLTTILPAGHPLDSVAVAPNIFQPYIDKAFELRCIVIGEKIFCAKLNSQASEVTRTDYRAGDDLEHEIFCLPTQVEASIHRLMDRFEINFAAMDMIVTPDGEYVFLELNPNGQWLWLEHELGLPLVSSMADLLATYHPRAEQPNVDLGQLQREAEYAA